MHRTTRRSLAAVCLGAALATTTGCAMSSAPRLEMTSAGAADESLVTGSQSSAESTTGGPGLQQGAALAAPGSLTGRVQAPDLIVVGRTTIARRLRERVARTPGVDAVEALGMASAPVGGRVITIGAVDPSSYRRFTPAVTARADAVWARVAEGDLAMSPELARDLRQPLGGDVTLGNQAGALTLRVGALASQPPKIDAAVNEVRGRQLGMVPDNALLVSTDGTDPTAVAAAVKHLVGGRLTVSSLSATTPPEGRQTAFLTGGSVAAAVGTFSYRYHPDGTVDPDPAWVAANLRTETVPILGRVTCHRVMLPQLRGALQEVVDSGLADKIDPADYGGCYSPRFIAHDRSQGLSLHTWGIAIDLNVQTNQRGTPGRIDPRVVDIFKRWGFAWGGDWSYTDPMHFELAALVRPR